jgi:thymidine kinase
MYSGRTGGVNMNSLNETIADEIKHLFNNWRHLIGLYYDGIGELSEGKLMKWASRLDPDDLICIYCGEKASVNRNGEFHYCGRCREYKGIIPNC